MKKGARRGRSGPPATYTCLQGGGGGSLGAAACAAVDLWNISGKNSPNGQRALFLSGDGAGGEGGIGVTVI